MKHNPRFTYSEEERRKRQNPELILSSLGLKKGMCFIDSGSNDGFFTLPAARIVGSSGRIIAIDVDEEALLRLKTKLDHENISNVEIINKPSENVIVASNIADIIFFGTVLHDFKDPLQVLKNSRSMLKDSGLILDYDWRKLNATIGPPYDIRFSEDEVFRLAKNSGLSVASAKIIDSNFYNVVLKK